MQHFGMNSGAESALSTASNATTVTWVPLLIAVLGLLSTLAGVIFTQIWNSRLESRRWEREHNRQHEIDSREDRNRTYEHRREAYVGFLRDMDRLIRSFTDIVDPPEPSYDALWDLWAIVMVYGTPEAQRIVEQCGAAIEMFQIKWEGDDVDDSVIDSMTNSWHKLLSQVRMDLGVSELPSETDDRTNSATGSERGGLP
jgi:hypothetical protein